MTRNSTGRDSSNYSQNGESGHRRERRDFRDEGDRSGGQRRSGSGGGGGYSGRNDRNSGGGGGGYHGGGSGGGGGYHGGNGGGGGGGGFRPRRSFDTPPPKIERHVVSAENGGATLEKWFNTNFPDIPGERLEVFSQRGSLRLDGQSTRREDFVKGGQEVSFPETMFKADRPRYDSQSQEGRGNWQPQRRGDFGDRPPRRDAGGPGAGRPDRGDGFRHGRSEGGDGSRRYGQPGGAPSSRGPGGPRSGDRDRWQRGGAREISPEQRRRELEGTPKYQLLCQNIQSWLIYRDENVIALNKPAGIPVQGGTGIDISIDDLIWVFGDKENQPRLVHRLDSGTSGLIIISLNMEAAVELGHIFKERKIDKKYLGVVCGVMESNEGVIDLPLSKNRDGAGSRNNHVRHHEDGKEAVTNYKVLSQSGEMSLVEFTIMTGRTHQIRAHSALVGCPILGDKKYSNFDGVQLSEALQKAQAEAPLMHLHSRAMSFKLFGQQYDLSAPLPDYFEQTLSKNSLTLSE